MNTRVLLVRHGETILSGQDRFAGSTDVPLSPDGRQQAECLAARLAEMPIAAVYAGPMQRTHDTAAIVARPHDLPIVGDVDLREISLRGTFW